MALDGLPVAHVERPLTGPQGLLAPRVDLTVVRVSGAADVGDATGFLLDAGLSISLLDDLQLDVTPVSVVFGDFDTDYGAFRLAATYRFADAGVAQVGGHVQLYVDGDRNVVATPGVPLRLYGGDVFRLDTGVHISVVAPAGGDTTGALGAPLPVLLSSGAGIPVEPAFQLVDPLWLGLTSGLGVGDLSRAADTFFVPLGFRVGGTVPADNEPAADITATLAFPQLVFTGADDKLLTELWTLTLGVQGFIGL